MIIENPKEVDWVHLITYLLDFYDTPDIPQEVLTFFHEEAGASILYHDEVIKRAWKLMYLEQCILIKKDK